MIKKNILFSLFFFLAAIYLLAAETNLKPDSPYYSIYKKGQDLFENKQYDKAIDEFEKLIKEKPDFPQPYLNIAMICELNNNYGKAIEYYVNYLEAGGEKKKKVIETIRNIANLKYLTSDKEFEQLKKGDEYYIKGVKSAKAKNYSAAIQEFEKSLEIIPYYVKAHYGLALAYNNKNEYFDAYEHFMKVLKYDPDNPDTIETYYYLGLLHDDLLIKDYNIALQFYNTYKEKRGLKNVDKFIKPIEEVNNLLSESINMFQANKKEEALSSLQKAKKIKPNDVRVLNNLGVMYIDQEKYKEAEVNLKKSLEIRKDAEDVYFNLACLYSKKGDVEKSAKYFKDGMKYFSKESIRKSLMDPDLKNLRKSDEFVKIIQTRDYNK